MNNFRICGTTENKRHFFVLSLVNRHSLHLIDYLHFVFIRIFMIFMIALCFRADYTVSNAHVSHRFSNSIF